MLNCCRLIHLILIAGFTLASFTGCQSQPKPEGSVSGAGALQSTDAEVRVASLNKALSPQTIEFGSCAHPRQPQPIWTAMLARKPDLYIGVGDNIYSSRTEDRPVEKMYELQAQIPELKNIDRLCQSWQLGMIMTLVRAMAEAVFLTKKNTNREFLKFFPNSKDLISPDQGGVYHSVILGTAPNTVQIIVLDTRYFRSDLEKQDHPKNPLDIYKPTKDKKKTFLGSDQWTWLDGELQKKAAWTIVVSSVQFIHQDHGFEKWGNFPHERNHFLSLLKKYKKKNLVIISGDRHQGEIHRIRVPGLGNLYDITASGINRTSNITDEPSQTRLGHFYSKENFGLFEFDWTNRKLKVSLIDISGNTIQSILFD